MIGRCPSAKLQQQAQHVRIRPAFDELAVGKATDTGARYHCLRAGVGFIQE